MRKTWLKIRNGFLSYSRGDRVGIIVLALLIVISIVVKIVLGRMESTPLLTREEFDEILLEWNNEKNLNSIDEKLSFFLFNPNTITENQLDSLALPGLIKNNLIKYRAAGGSFKSKTDIRKLYGMTDSIFQSIEPFVEIPIARSQIEEKKIIDELITKKIPEGNFDPNTASVEVLKSYGLNDFQAKNIVAYRESGGSYNKSKDLLKIYGLDSVTFNTVSRFVNIEAENGAGAKTVKKELHIDINSADTTDLMLIKGIGQVYALRIIKYRDLLGGFYSTNQLMEVYGFTEELFLNIKPYVYVDTMAIRKIRINYAEFSELIRHPYFNKPAVNAILSEKDKNGPLKNIVDLTHLKAIDNEFVEKVKPYITCR